MQRAILFTFHNYLGICRNHLRLLAAFNPGVPIFGLFGGPERLFPILRPAAPLLFGSALTHLSCISGQSKYWKWANTDLATRLWYRDVGRRYSFDVLHVVQWDLAFFVPLDRAYAHVPPDQVGLTGLTPLSAVEDRWSWLTGEPFRSDSRALLDYARTRLGYDQTPYACVGPGMCLPRAFLERYLMTEPPPFGHDELRVPLMAQSLGFSLHDTGFYPRWFDSNPRPAFHADAGAIDPAVIKQELAKQSGCRVFHPVRSHVHADWVKRGPVADADGSLVRQQS